MRVCVCGCGWVGGCVAHTTLVHLAAVQAARKAHAEAMERLGEDAICEGSAFPCPVCRAPVTGFVVGGAGEGEEEIEGQKERKGRGDKQAGVACAAAAAAAGGVGAAASDELDLDKGVSRYLTEFRKDMARMKAERQAKAERLRALQDKAEAEAETVMAAAAREEGDEGKGTRKKDKASCRGRRKQRRRKQKD